MNTGNLYSIKEASKRLDIPSTTIRWFLKNGLIPHVKRQRNGYRVLDDAQLDLLQVLFNMKRAGFPKKEIRQYSRLYRQGEQTAEQRLAMLTTRKRQIWQEITERQKSIDFIERQEEILAQAKRQTQ